MIDRPKRPSTLPTAVGSSMPPTPQVEISPSSDRVIATLPTGESCEVLLFGATLVSWKSDGGRQENLWMSDAAKVDGSKAVRGGIPLVFPIFGPPPETGLASGLPQHGFARISRWEFLGKSTSESDSSVQLDFGLASSSLSPEMLAAWPCEFGVIYSVTLGRESLDTRVVVRNEGTTGWEFKWLWHTYLGVEDIEQTHLTGLSSTPYHDKVLSVRTTSPPPPATLTVTSETDRVYSPHDPQSPIVVHTPNPRYEVTRENLPDVVVWNPWEEKAGGMADFEPKDGWRRMLCVEAGSVGEWVKLDGGEAWEGRVGVKLVEEG